jgi:hypothetical protein
MDTAELKVESNWDNEGKKCYPVCSVFRVHETPSFRLIIYSSRDFLILKRLLTSFTVVVTISFGPNLQYSIR